MAVLSQYVAPIGPEPVGCVVCGAVADCIVKVCTRHGAK